MNSTNTHRETSVLEALKRLQETYGKATALADQLSGAFSDRSHYEQLLLELQNNMAAAAELERGLKSRLGDETKLTGPAGQLAGQISELIKGLIEKVNLAEQAAAESKERLLPQIQTEVQMQKMRDAYLKK